MSKDVPIWLAVSATAIAGLAGSLDIFDWAFELIDKKPAAITQHYFVLKNEPVEGQPVETSVLQDMQQLGSGQIIWANQIENFFQEVTSSNLAVDWCKNKYGDDYHSSISEEVKLYGCYDLDLRLVFFSVRNNSKEPITNLEFKLRKFEFNDTTNSTLLTQPTEVQLAVRENSTCIVSAWDDPTDSNTECFAKQLDEITINLSQPLLQNEYVHLPLQAYVQHKIEDGGIEDVGNKLGFLPKTISINGNIEIDARNRSATLVLQNERVEAGG